MADHEIHEIAVVVMAELQLKVWTMSQQGMSQRSIAYTLDLSRTTVSDALDGGWRALRKNGVQVTPDGTPYLEQEHA